MDEQKQTKDSGDSGTRERLVKEETKRTRVSSNGNRRRSRRSRRGILFRGSLFEGIYQATLEGFVAASDTFRDAVNGFVERDREDRDRGRGRLGGVASNLVDSGWDAYDSLVRIPRRAWDAYRDEIDADDNDVDDADDSGDRNDTRTSSRGEKK